MGYIGENLWRIREKHRKNMSPATRKKAPGEFKILGHGYTHYELAGDPNDPLLICIHGWTTGSYVWKQLREKFVGLGYHVLTYDLYGRNFSDRPKVAHTAELFTEQLTQLLQALGLNDRRLNLIGYSMGGAIAAHFASKRLADVDRLLLIAPAGMETRAPKLRRIARENPRFFDPHILFALPLPLRWQFHRAAFGYNNNKSVREVRRKQLRELEYKGYVEALLSSLKGILATKMMKEHQAIASQSSIKVKALFANQDKTIPWPDARNLFDKWNTKKVSVTIEGAGHGVTYTHVPEIMRQVSGFL